jgi:hypothetical protein
VDRAIGRKGRKVMHADARKVMLVDARHLAVWEVMARVPKELRERIAAEAHLIVP